LARRLECRRRRKKKEALRGKKPANGEEEGKSLCHGFSLSLAGKKGEREIAGLAAEPRRTKKSLLRCKEKGKKTSLFFAERRPKGREGKPRRRDN